jgi:hypothetical protein
MSSIIKSWGSAYTPVVGGMSVPALLFAEWLDIDLFAVNGLQNGIDQVGKYGDRRTEYKIK